MSNFKPLLYRPAAEINISAVAKNMQYADTMAGLCIACFEFGIPKIKADIEIANRADWQLKVFGFGDPIALIDGLRNDIIARRWPQNS